MAVIADKNGIWADANSTTIPGAPISYLCDTTGELPTGLEGDTAYTKDSHRWYVRKASAWVELAAGGGGDTIPPGLISLWHGLLANIPAGWLLCDGANGTPDLRGKFIKGAAAAAEPGSTGGALTHTHTDHSALSHSGAAVDDHAAHTHTVTSNVSVNDHASHTHTYTQVPNHVHVENGPSSASGGLVGWAPDTSTNTSVASGYSTANPTGGVATGTTNGPSATLTHTANNNQVTSGNPSATLTHSVTQPSNHTISAHDSSNHEPPFYTVAYIMKS